MAGAIGPNGQVVRVLDPRQACIGWSTASGNPSTRGSQAIRRMALNRCNISVRGKFLRFLVAAALALIKKNLNFKRYV
jgi:hypothetical protein